MIFVISAPSGGGKGTILAEAFKRDEQLVHAISVTTRKPRDNEQDGVHYHYTDTDTFKSWIEEDRFLEWAEVHGNLYGTLQDEMVRQLETGHDVIFELDVQGMRSVKEHRPDAVTVFIMPPSFEVWEQRMRDRGGLVEAEMALRLRNGKDEMAAKHEYDFEIINDDLEEAVDAFSRIVAESRQKNSRK